MDLEFDQQYEDDYNDGGSYYNPDYNSTSLFESDPLYYHSKVSFEALGRESKLAIEIQLAPGMPYIWFPKSTLKKLKRKKRTVYVWNKMLNQKRSQAAALYLKQQRVI